MSQSRIEEIEKEIASLIAEKKGLLKIKNKPVIQEKIKDYLGRTYSGGQLLKKHTLDEKGLWKVRGEDPNCDLGGSHHQPDLGVVEGTLQEALEYALAHKDFYTWGGGGNFEKITTIKLK